MFKVNYRSFVVIVDVIVSVLAPGAVDHGLEPRSVKPKTIKLIIVASPLSMQH
jgi:hypothetical protein